MHSSQRTPFVLMCMFHKCLSSLVSSAMVIKRQTGEAWGGTSDPWFTRPVVVCAFRARSIGLILYCTTVNLS